jgi:cytochrome bd-type quinol oxidase subunit 1
MSLLDLSRWQFAATVMFHMTFPAITVGLSILLCVLYGMHWRTGKERHGVVALEDCVILLTVALAPPQVP